MSVVGAAATSNSLSEFNDKGSVQVVANTGLGALSYATDAYAMYKIQTPKPVYDSYNLNGSKDSNYINNRGWNDSMINNAINNGKQGSTINMANGASCTAYGYPGTDNQYVVIENYSRNVVQVSDFNDTGWIPDYRISWE